MDSAQVLFGQTSKSDPLDGTADEGPMKKAKHVVSRGRTEGLGMDRMKAKRSASGQIGERCYIPTHGTAARRCFGPGRPANFSLVGERTESKEAPRSCCETTIVLLQDADIPPFHLTDVSKRDDPRRAVTVPLHRSSFLLGSVPEVWIQVLRG